MNYSLQSNRKTTEGSTHPDRDKQFEHIANTVTRFQQRHRPVISVDTKKKELVGNYKNTGQEWQPKRQPTEVNIHDFVNPKLGKVIPYGVYDRSLNQGFVSVGIDHDTA
ncbi:MAG: ISAzo13 family transposase ISNpu10 [Chroococcidiopsis cubana SAG 39.79]|nr:ISAzo13 family transposase ISNpu10 [Chroococcidiopsis cubana SAG 39.79]